MIEGRDSSVGAAKRKGGSVGVSRSALARLEFTDGLVDDIDAATPPNDPAVLVAILQRLQGTCDFHDTGAGLKLDENTCVEGGELGMAERSVNRAFGRIAPCTSPKTVLTG